MRSFNASATSDQVGEIHLSRGYVAIVDAEDHARVATNKWSALYSRGGRIYACRRIPVRDGGGLMLLHRFIMQPPERALVDHINGDPLDDRRSNLRICTYAENNRNAKLRKDSKSGLKGAYWHSRDKCWKAHIRIDGKLRDLGRFASAEAAHAAYCKEAERVFGEFARVG